MDDWREEETLARLSGWAREEVERLRGEGEPNPVILFTSDGVLAESERPSCLEAIRPAEVEELLNTHVSACLETKILNAPIIPSHAFRIIYVLPGTVLFYSVISEPEGLLWVAIFSIDVENRIVKLKNANKPGW